MKYIFSLLLSFLFMLPAQASEELPDNLFAHVSTPSQGQLARAKDILGRTDNLPLRDFIVGVVYKAIPEDDAENRLNLLDLLCQRDLLADTAQHHRLANLSFNIFYNKQVLCKWNNLTPSELVMAIRQEFGDSLKALVPQSPPSPHSEALYNYLGSPDKLDELSATQDYDILGKQIIELLQEASQARGPGFQLAYLKAPAGRNPLKLFDEFADAIFRSGIAFDQSLLIWGKLGKAYLRLAALGFTQDQQFEEADEFFVTELESKSARSETSYQWFTLFMDRISILMTTPALRWIKYNINDLFDRYRNGLVDYQYHGRPAFLSHDGWLEACRNTGSLQMRKILSPEAMTHIKDIVMMPYPFDLSDKDILERVPRPNGKRLYPNGFALGFAFADGQLYTPSLFRDHDRNHLAIMIAALNHSLVTYGDAPGYGSPDPESLWQRVREGRQLFFQLIDAMIKVVNLKEDQISSKQRRMNIFLSFWLSHEGNAMLENRMAVLVDSEKLTSNLLNPNNNLNGLHNLMDPYYFGSLVPASNMPEAEFRGYVESFLQTLWFNAEDPELREKVKEFADLESWYRQWFGSLPVKCSFDINCGRIESIDNDPNVLAYNEGFIPTEIDISMTWHEDLSQMFKRLNPHQKDLSQDVTHHDNPIVRIFFEASPLYIGEEQPPRSVEQFKSFDSRVWGKSL